MPAIASTVFKIKATADYIAPTPEILSFRKGQPFYALAADYERGLYHVSTQYATPFARNAVAGVVPMALFVQVDLMSKDDRIIPSNHHKNHQQAARAAAAAVAAAAPGVAGNSTVTTSQVRRHEHVPAANSMEPANTTTSIPVVKTDSVQMASERKPSITDSQPQQQRDPHMMKQSSSNTSSSSQYQSRMDAQWSQLLRVPVNNIEMLSLQCLGNNIDVYRMRICRGDFAHAVARTTLDLIQLHKALLRDGRYSVTELPSFPVADFSMDAMLKQQRVEHYLNHLLMLVMSQDTPDSTSALVEFLKPKHENECMLSRAVRRDSGFDEFDKDTTHKNRLLPNRKASLTGSGSSNQSSTTNSAPRKQHGNSFFTQMFSHN